MTETAMKAGLPMRTWRLLWEPSMRGRLFLWSVAILISIVCGPIGHRLLLALAVAPLPELLSPIASFAFFALDIFVMFAWITIAGLAPAYVVTAAFGRTKQKHWILALVVWVISWGSLPVSWRYDFGKNWGLERITTEAQPLIEAIEAYHAGRGEYPPDLKTLVPEYLNEIPHTGAIAYPNFRYARAEPDSLFKTYEVLVRTSIGLSFDVFVYWPEGNYPERMYGGWVEPISDWAYVHE